MAQQFLYLIGLFDGYRYADGVDAWFDLEKNERVTITGTIQLHLYFNYSIIVFYDVAPDVLKTSQLDTRRLLL